MKKKSTGHELAKNDCNQLPEGWISTTIGKIGKVVSGGTPSSKEPSYWGGSINWIAPSDLSGYTQKIISEGRKSLTEEGLKHSSAKLLPKGSVLFSSRAPIGYVAIASSELCTNQGFKNLIPAGGVFNEYVYYFLKGAKRLAEERASGTTFLEISGKSFSGLPIPLPPLAEQKRIVAKIEELFSELDAGVANLKAAREKLKIYRQSLLKFAFEGKLTADWRAQQKKGDSPTAKELLERIKTERDQLKGHLMKKLDVPSHQRASAQNFIRTFHHQLSVMFWTEYSGNSGIPLP